MSLLCSYIECSSKPGTGPTQPNASQVTKLAPRRNACKVHLTPTRDAKNCSPDQEGDAKGAIAAAAARCAQRLLRHPTHPLMITSEVETASSAFNPSSNGGAITFADGHPSGGLLHAVERVYRPYEPLTETPNQSAQS